MTPGSSRTLAGRARSAVGRALGSKSPEEPVNENATAKQAGKKAPAKKPGSKKATATKTPAKKTATKQTATKKPAASATLAKQSTTKKSTTSSEKTTATKKASAAPTTTTDKDAPVATTKTRARKGTPGALVVLPSEKPWTKEELDKVEAHLREDVVRLVPEVNVADAELHDLMVDAGDGAGADQADVGSSSFERDQGLTIAKNAREMLEQSQHALERIADGSYGVCETCGEPIGKKRLMAFPRATLCMTCKQREERH